MRSHFQLVLFTVLFGLLAWFSMALRAPISLSTLIWPAGGVMLGVLMLCERRQWPQWLAITFVLHTAIGLWAGRSLAEALVFPVTQILVAPVVAAVWRSKARTPYTLASMHNLLWFLGLLVTGAFAGGGIISAALMVLGVTTPAGNWIAPVISDIVGSLIGVPFILAWMNGSARRSGGTTTAEWWRGLLWLALLALSAHTVFDGPTALATLGSTRYELSYLPIILLVLVAMQWDSRGLSVALLTLAGIATWNTLQGEGPFATPGEPVGVALLELQAYLGATALLGLLMGAITAARHRALRRAAALKVRFEAALTSSQHLAYEFDPVTQRILWGGDCIGLLGVHPEEIATFTQFLARVPVQDQPELLTAVQEYGQAQRPLDTAPHTRRFRFLCGDGQYRLLVDRGAALPGLDDDIFRISGLLRVIPTADELTNGV